jgi:hypothetical protein
MVNMIAGKLTRDAVEELSRQKSEPEWMLQRRLQAWDILPKVAATRKVLACSHIRRRGRGTSGVRSECSWYWLLHDP